MQLYVRKVDLDFWQSVQNIPASRTGMAMKGGVESQQLDKCAATGRTLPVYSELLYRLVYLLI